jgi:hypothetical protein
MSTAKADLTTEERARRRARFYLLDTYERQLEEAGLAAIATVARGYVPSGFTRPVDVAEIGGLAVTTDAGETHLRLYRDGSVGLIGAALEDGSPIAVDPMSDPVPTDRYLTGGVPDTVRDVLDVLDVTPRWADACPDGAHAFETAGADGPPQYRFVKCGRCDHSAEVLSWLGHGVPLRRGGGPE